jgi:hypothetical protein
MITAGPLSPAFDDSMGWRYANHNFGRGVERQRGHEN